MQTSLPLSGLKVVEFTHMVMGPTAGLVLADLGADVVKIEPLGGDNTRRLRGSGAGYFPMYSRNKRSLCLDLKSEAGMAIAKRLIDRADVLIENFRPGAMEALGLGEAACAAANPGLIYCSAKGFLSGPYEQRTALDEVAQMMGGLAYMTGPPGRPLRAGASVLDVMGGLFGAIGVLAALHSRGKGGGGAAIRSGLYENCVFLVGQHMAQYAVTGQPANPMPARVSAWAIYDLFTTKDGEQVFIGVVTDSQWRTFCDAFGLGDLGADAALAANNGRVDARERIIPRVQALVAGLSKVEITERLEAIGLPFAPVARPQDLFDDPHLTVGGLLPIELPDGGRTTLPALPMEINGRRPGLRIEPPRAGVHSREVLSDAGYAADEIEALVASGVVGEAQ
ncbi:MAG TPA: CaiB/BaiF CoA-transferase family protein [Caulobacteraceae bacterium]|nr:CaiB/BaiF CoA-transferase family protein [Caulobacteraceae bacterium]